MLPPLRVGVAGLGNVGAALVGIIQRDAAELGEIPDGVDVDNRAFDITPAALITGYITEAGVTPRR